MVSKTDTVMNKRSTTEDGRKAVLDKKPKWAPEPVKSVGGRIKLHKGK